MKTAVMGAGAVGCYFGGLLARAGHEVVLIGREAGVQALRAHGLRLQTRSFDEVVAVQADTSAAAAAGAELVLCCVKSPDTAAAGAALKPHLRADAVVLSLQNGVDNAERLAAALGRPAEPAVVYVATEMAGPAHLMHHGRGELVIGPFAGHQRVVDTFAAAGVPVQVSDNVAGALWAKLVINCAYNALSALMQQPYGQLVQGDGVSAVIDDLVRESLAVAAAAGVSVPGDMSAAVRRIAETMAGQYSSTAQDMARGKRSEIDHLNGHVVRLGDALGVPVPANRVLHTLVKLHEARAANAPAP